MAVAEASFNTSIDSISDGLISPMPPVTGTPSITYNGSLLAVIERLPRIITLGVEPGDQLELETTTPGMRPCNASDAVVAGTAVIFAALTEATAPVRSLFLTVP